MAAPSIGADIGGNASVALADFVAKRARGILTFG
jgi:hypothetical protein